MTSVSWGCFLLETWHNQPLHSSTLQNWVVSHSFDCEIYWVHVLFLLVRSVAAHALTLASVQYHGWQLGFVLPSFAWCVRKICWIHKSTQKIRIWTTSRSAKPDNLWPAPLTSWPWRHDPMWPDSTQLRMHCRSSMVIYSRTGVIKIQISVRFLG